MLDEIILGAIGVVGMCGTYYMGKKSMERWVVEELGKWKQSYLKALAEKETQKLIGSAISKVLTGKEFQQILSTTHNNPFNNVPSVQYTGEEES